jgi:hypothetical protein
MFDLSQLAGLDASFDYQGKKYDLKELDFEQGAKFSKWVKERAKAEAARSDHLPGDFGKTMASVVLADIAAGHYDWGGPVCVSALFSPEGAANALQIALAAEHDLDIDACRGIVKAKLSEIAEYLLRQAELGKASADPGASSPPGPTASRGAGTSRRSGTGRR